MKRIASWEIVSTGSRDDATVMERATYIPSPAEWPGTPPKAAVVLPSGRTVFVDGPRMAHGASQPCYTAGWEFVDYDGKESSIVRYGGTPEAAADNLLANAQPCKRLRARFAEDNQMQAALAACVACLKGGGE